MPVMRENSWMVMGPAMPDCPTSSALEVKMSP
jgi:hypothetical protein